MNPVVVIDQEGIELAIEGQKEFIIDPHLEELFFQCYVHGGLTMTLGSAKIVAKKLKNHAALKTILISNHLLCAESARWICGSLATIKSLESITFTHTFTEPDAMKWIVELIKSKPKLKQFIIEDNRVFMYHNAKDLFTALEHASHLETFHLRCNTLDSTDALDSLANFLKRNNSLKIFHVGPMTEELSKRDRAWIKVTDGVAENTSITTLELYNAVFSEGILIDSFVRCFRRRNNLADLTINGSLVSKEIEQIIESFMVNDSIESLTLSGISPEGYQALAKYLAQTDRLTFLNLSSAPKAGLEHFWEGLKKNKTLTKLVMYYTVYQTNHDFAIAQQTLWMHPSIYEFGCTGFYMDEQHPLTQKLRQNQENIRNRRKEMAFIILMLAKSAVKFPPEIWSLILRHVTVPSFNRLIRADKLFDFIIQNYEDIFQRIFRGDWFKIVQEKDGRFVLEEGQMNGPEVIFN